MSREYARSVVRQQSTLLGAVMLRAGRIDALLCGTLGRYATHVDPVRDVIGPRAGVKTLATMQMLILPERQLFICDTQINLDPSAEQVAEIAVLAAAEVRRFGVEPRVALLSHSNFGASDAPSALKMRQAVALAKALDPTLPIAGEMRGDAALSSSILERESADRVARRRSQRAGDAQRGRRQHRLQPAAHRGRQRHHGRRHPARRGVAGAHPGALVDGAAHRQHDGAGGGRCRSAAARGQGSRHERRAAATASSSSAAAPAGSNSPRALGDTLGRRGKADITLIDRTRTHVWKPKLHEIAAGSMDMSAHEVGYLAQSHWHHFRYRVGAMIGPRPRAPRGAGGALHRRRRRAGDAAAQHSATTRW